MRVFGEMPFLKSDPISLAKNGCNAGSGSREGLEQVLPDAGTSEVSGRYLI